MDFEQIEDKILDTLKTALTYARTVETYAGQLEAEIGSLAINFPAVYVSYGGSTLEWQDAVNYLEEVSFTVLVCAKNLRGSAAMRKDAEGCYQMIEDVKAALANNNFNLDIEHLKPVKVGMVFISGTMAIYGIDFQTNFESSY